MRRLMAAAIAALLLVTAFSVPGPKAQTACPGGVPLSLVEFRLSEVVPPGDLEIERISGRAVGVVLDRLNAEPPESDFSADQIVVAYWRGKPTAQIFPVLAGCVQGRISYPEAKARLLTGKAT